MEPRTPRFPALGDSISYRAGEKAIWEETCSRTRQRYEKMGHSEKWGDSAGDLIANGTGGGGYLSWGKEATFFFKATLLYF